MDIQWHPQLCTSFINRRHQRVVQMDSFGHIRLKCDIYTQSFIGYLSDTLSSHFVATLQFLDGCFYKRRLSVIRQVEATPQIEPVFIRSINFYNRIERSPGISSQYNCFLDAFPIHSFHPLSNLFERRRVIVRVCIDNRIFSFFDLRFGYFINRFRHILFQQYILLSIPGRNKKQSD